LRVWHYFHALSNELQSTKILICPADKERIENAASDFGTGPASLRVRGKQDLAVSYFLGLSADKASPQALLSGDRNLSDSETGEPFSSHQNGPLRITGMAAWTTKVPIHDYQGNVVIADGSVQQLTSQRLADGIAHVSNSYGTNASLFLFPQ
jgi:hypothetical protein